MAHAGSGFPAVSQVALAEAGEGGGSGAVREKPFDPLRTFTWASRVGVALQVVVTVTVDQVVLVRRKARRAIASGQFAAGQLVQRAVNTDE